MNIHQAIYKKLIQLIPHIFDLKLEDSQTSKVFGFMDLHLDVIWIDKDYMHIALSHTYQLNGDCVPDPDIEIKIFRSQMAEALTFQDLAHYHAIYPGKGKVDINAKKSLNEFLLQWLTNCLEQGYSFARE